MSDNSTQRRATKQPADHPKYAEMITAVIVALKERNGSSRKTIKKHGQLQSRRQSKPVHKGNS